MPSAGRLGLDGDEQADPSVHGGLDKAVYAYPAAHYAFWQAQRRERGVSLFDETLPPGFMGENSRSKACWKTRSSWATACISRTACCCAAALREPCYKFDAVMGFARAGRTMALAGNCGYYLAVEQPGTIAAGQEAWLQPGQRALSIAQAIAGKWGTRGSAAHPMQVIFDSCQRLLHKR